MKILIAADHAGFEKKRMLADYLTEMGYEVVDFGALTLDENDDYPDFIKPLAEALEDENGTARGIILGGSGQGEAMAANRFKGIRAAVIYSNDEKILMLTREHNNANVLSLGARFLAVDEIKQIVKTWLSVPFSGAERHVRRLAKLDE